MMQASFMRRHVLPVIGNPAGISLIVNERVLFAQKQARRYGHKLICTQTRCLGFAKLTGGSEKPVEQDLSEHDALRRVLGHRKHLVQKLVDRFDCGNRIAFERTIGQECPLRWKAASRTLARCHLRAVELRLAAGMRQSGP